MYSQCPHYTLFSPYTKHKVRDLHSTHLLYNVVIIIVFDVFYTSELEEHLNKLIKLSLTQMQFCSSYFYNFEKFPRTGKSHMIHEVQD